MRTFLTILFFFCYQFCFCQANQLCEAVYELKLAYRPARVQILKDTNSLYSSLVNNVQKITYIDMPPGQYKIRISGQGQIPQIIDSIFVKEGQQLVLSFHIDGPCLYDHPVGYVPVCPQKHRDNIVPILYGLIVTKVEKFKKDKDDLEVRYGGCVVTGCDPQFYCKQHDIEF